MRLKKHTAVNDEVHAQAAAAIEMTLQWSAGRKPQDIQQRICLGPPALLLLLLLLPPAQFASSICCCCVSKSGTPLALVVKP
jgi:hypothetical protein